MDRSAQCVQCGRVQDKYTTIPTVELEALRAKSSQYAATILCIAEKLDVGLGGYARGLIKAMAPQHPTTPEWKPEDDVLGILMQIDNISAGFRAKAEVGKLDTARLDRVIALLGADALTLMPSQKDNGNMLLCPVYEGIVNKKFSEGKTAREAIDAAMKETNV